MAWTLTELSDHLSANGMACEVVGDASASISGVATLEDAGLDEVSFLANPKYAKQLETTRAGAVVVGQQVEAPAGTNVLRVADPYAAITMLMVHMHGPRRHPEWGISGSASVAGSARVGARANVGPGVTIGDDVVIGDGTTIYPGCFIGVGCRLGDGVTLYPNVVLYERTVLGHRVAIHSGTVVGNDGLGYAPVGKGWAKIPQIGHVEVADDVEIGSNCSIDRATLGTTVIGAGTKFSNLIAIGHGTKVGPNCMFVAQVGIAGSTTVGAHVMMAGQVGVAGHLTVGDDVQVGAKSGVMNHVAAGATVLGQPAMPIAQAKRVYSMLVRLPDWRDRVKALESEVAALRKRLADDGQGA